MCALSLIHQILELVDQGMANALAHDGGLRSALSKNGLETIRQRHTCAHRADELLTIVEQLRTEYRGAA